MKLSIIILTWNSKKYIKDCLSSLIESLNGVTNEIIVVDNGSSDDSTNILEQEYHDVVLIKNRVNIGVAPARNQGMSIAKGEYILILDIDTCIYPDTIKRMISFMDENTDTAICAPKLIYSDGTAQKSCRKFPLVHMKLLRRINTNWAKEILESENYTRCINGSKPFEVDYVIGACQLIRKSAMDKVGLLDNNIFYGPEDVDYCLRMWLNAFKVMYLPYVKIIHYEQRVTRNNMISKITFKHIISLAYFFRKHEYYFSRQKIYNKLTKIK